MTLEQALQRAAERERRYQATVARNDAVRALRQANSDPHKLAEQYGLTRRSIGEIGGR